MRGEFSGADAPGVRVVHIGAGVDKQLRGGKIADARRKQQRGIAAMRNGAVVVKIAVRRDGHHLGPGIPSAHGHRHVREQRLHDFRMFLRRPPTSMPSGRARRARYVGAFRKQLFDDVGIARCERPPSAASRRASSVAFGLAPAASSRRTIAALPFWQAVHNGVAPRSFAAFTFAPARIRRSALSTSSR